MSRFIDRTNAFYASVTDNLREAARHTALLQPTSHSETVLFTSAFHCNIGMARPTGELARLWKPSLVVSAGDDALGASGLDASCVDSIGYHLRGRNVVVAPGDHDSDDAEVAMRRRDFAVLDARPVEASGLRILGDDDPRVAVLSGGLTPRRNETVTQMGHRLANLACADKDGIDVLVANEPGAVLETARRGCAKLVLAGSEQNEVFRVPSPVGAPVPAYLAGSAGGAAPNTLTVGTLQAPAHEAIIEIDKATGQPMRYQQVEFGVHGSVVIASITTFAGSPLQSRPR